MLSNTLISLWYLVKKQLVQPNEIDLGQTAILLIDMQKFFVDKLAVSERDCLIYRQIGMMDYGLQKGMPLAVLEYQGDGPTIEPLISKAKTFPNHIFITKKHDNGFEGTKLEDKLSSWNTKRVLLMGINASWCVRKTAQGAKYAKLDFITVDELMADESEDYRYTKYQDWYRKNGIYIKSHKDLIGISG